MKKKLYGIFLAFTVFTSCATFKGYEPQTVDVIHSLRKELQDRTSLNDTTSLLHWQNFYKDQRLQELIREGLEKNKELETARLRVEEATASLRGAYGLLLPSVSLTGEGNISSFDGAKAEKTYNLSTTLNWETDIVGKQRNAIKGTIATIDERRAYRQLVRTRLIATIAEAYYTLEMLDAKKKVLEETIDSWKRQVTVLQALMEAGETESSAVAQAEASLYESKTMLVLVEKQLFETEGSLSMLLAKTPSAISRGVFSDQDFSNSLATDIPVTALATRPDVLQAEAALRSSFYQVNVARAAFYPSLRLSASTGWTNNGSMGIANPGSLLLQAITSLTQPLFVNGQNRANLAIAQSQQKQAMAQFSQTLLEAGNEVSNALKAYQTATRQTNLQEHQIRKLQEAIRAADAQMRYGDGNALQIIVARQSLQMAQLQQLASKYEKIENYIILFRTLGGGN